MFPTFMNEANVTSEDFEKLISEAEIPVIEDIKEPSKPKINVREALKEKFVQVYHCHACDRPSLYFSKRASFRDSITFREVFFPDGSQPREGESLYCLECGTRFEAMESGLHLIPRPDNLDERIPNV